MPTVAIISPRIVENIPLAADLPESEATAVIAKSISVKYSAGPNLRAIEERGRANSVRATMPMVPAMNEPMADTARAAPARPLSAIS